LSREWIGSLLRLIAQQLDFYGNRAVAQLPSCFPITDANGSQREARKL
jgi:hypothetical protein